MTFTDPTGLLDANPTAAMANPTSYYGPPRVNLANNKNANTLLLILAVMDRRAGGPISPIPGSVTITSVPGKGFLKNVQKSEFEVIRDSDEKGNQTIDVIKTVSYPTRMTNGTDSISSWQKDFPTSTPVVAPVSGMVKYAGDKGENNGNTLIYETGDGFTTLLKHLIANETFRNLKVGDVITMGEVLGFIGKTGLGPKYGPHLHMEITKDGKNVPVDEFIPDMKKAGLDNGLDGVTRDGKGALANKLPPDPETTVYSYTIHSDGTKPPYWP